MKNKIFLGLLSFVAGLSMVSCIEEEALNIPTDALLNESSVVTGTADVTATSATFHGSVQGLDGMAASSYNTGFSYGYSETALTESVNAPYDGENFSATITGLQTGTTIYYQAFVRLQGKVYYRGAVAKAVTTNATVATAQAVEVNAVSAVLGGTVKDAPEGAECGVIISASSDIETVRGGVKVAAAELAADYEITKAGLLPSTTYYYVAYLDLGSGVVYGDVESFTTAAHEFDLDNDLVDLGLSVKWAKYNVGAVKEAEFGGLFGFGDLNGVMTSINPADYASADTYKTTSDLAFKVTDGRATLPTAADFEELFSVCKKEWTEVDGVPGYKLTGPNGNSIFLPAAGSRIESTVAGEGLEGYYLTGTINPTNSSFAVTYQFNQSLDTKTTTPVYQAVAVRPVSTAKNVPFKKELLYTKWYLDNGQDEGEQHVFEGPYTQWGVTDCWETISNGQPNIEQSIHWEMGTGNGWIGYTYGKDYGYMEFLEDGTFNVHRIAEDGTVTDEVGTFIIDEENKTVTVDIDLIHGNTWLPAKKGTLKILTLTEDGMQILLDAGDNTYGYSLNYYSEAKKIADAKLKVNLLCVGGDWAGTWGSTVDKVAPEALGGSHTFTYEGSCSSAMVFTLDFVGLREKYPNAIVTITDMKCDGASIKYDPTLFFYGDIENNGNYRIELFNIWGKGSVDGVIAKSPFSGAEGIGNDPAFTFAEKFEVTYYIVLEPTFTPNLITINPSWGGTWGYNEGASINVVVDENFKLKMTNTEFDLTYESVDHTAGSIMTFIEVADMYGAFPATHATLDELYLDGEAVEFDQSKVIDSQETPKYRLELWNCYGKTKDLGCAFGTPTEAGVLEGLAFSSSMRTVFTFHSLFPEVTWE